MVLVALFTQVPGSASAAPIDGALDTTFNPNNTGTNGDVRIVTIQSDGSILIGGAFSSYNGTATGRVTRLNGTVPPSSSSTNPSGSSSANAQSDSSSLAAAGADTAPLLGVALLCFLLALGAFRLQRR